ncbi:uncharacterized protein LOC143358413 [Halictus rubicundus]|uniref:uncharacterized protein LOC143358413 n=1 Tax=Halictus rubicundus TaxID=77578 RepID=UPI00403639E5
MSNTGDMYKNWLAWKKCFLDYMKQSNYTNSEEYKITVLKSLIGKDALNSPPVYHILHNRIHIAKCSTLAEKLERLDILFSEMKNELVERYNFFNRFRLKDEPIETYILDLKEKAKTCNFGYLSDSIIRDKVIANIHSKELRSRLFQTLHLDLATLIKIYKIYEAENKSSSGKIVEKRQTQTDASHSDNIAIVKASNSNNKKIAEGKQNSNKKDNANINVKTRKDSKNDKTKTDPKNDKTRTDPKNDKSTTDPKNDKSTTDPKNDKTKTDPKNDNGTANRRHSDISNKAKTDPKNDNRGNNIIGTANRRHSDISNKAETDSKMDNSDNNLIDFKENYINDKTKIHSKGMNSNHNTSMVRRNSETSGTQYRRKCWRCNDSHAQRCCPAWGYKCEKCGERNHFTNCCQMELCLKREVQHINTSAKENVSNPISCQHENQPKPIPRSNYNFTANIEPEYTPSAPEFFEPENELYPNLYHMSTFPASEPPNPEATIDNTESTKPAATETQNPAIRSNSEKDICSIS